MHPHASKKNVRQMLLQAMLFIFTIAISGTPIFAQQPSLSKDEIEAIVADYLRSQGLQTSAPDSSAETVQSGPIHSIFNRLSGYANFRLRQESSFKMVGSKDRHRTRVRMRLGTSLEINKEFSVNARLTTGDPTDANSPYATLGDGFQGQEISLDRAFVHYQPDWLKKRLSLRAGKFKHRFVRNPIYGELVWDADINPEGFAAEFSGGESTKWQLNIGQYLITESSASDQSLSVGQFSVIIPLQSAKVHAAVGYYRYDGNLLNPQDVFNPILSISSSLRGHPLIFSTEYIHNMRTGSRNRGGAIGMAYGSTANLGAWKAYYQWQLIEQNAVDSSSAQDDFLFRTNHRSHIFGAKTQLSNKVGLHLWALASRLDRSSINQRENTQWRARLDFDFIF